MGYLIKQSSTSRALVFLMVDSTDHVTGKTGLSPTVTIRKEGGAFGAPAGAVTEIANGWYQVAANATDCGTLGSLLLHAEAAGADPVDDRFEVVSFDPDDAVALGLSRLDAAISSRMATFTLPTNFALLGINGSGHISRVTLVDTTTTNTDMRGTDAAALASVATEARLAELDAANLPADIDAILNDTDVTLPELIGQIAVAGAAVNKAAGSYVLTTGTQSANTVASTVALDGVRHEHTDSAGALELYYEFDVGTDGVAAQVKVQGYLNGPNDTVGVYAYDWNGATWDQIGSRVGTSSTANATNTFDLLGRHTGTGANLGKVRIRYYAASGLTTALLAIDQILVTHAQVAPTAAVIADQVWEEPIADHSPTSGSTAEQLAAAGAGGDPWSTAVPGAYGAGTAGQILGDNLDTTVGSRSSHAAADVWAVGTRTLTSFGTLVSDVAAAVWAAGTRTLTSFGTLAADVWAATTRVLTAGTNIVLAKGVGVTGFNDLSAAQVNAEADTAIADAGLATAGDVAALNDLSAAQVGIVVDTSLATYDAPTKAEMDAGFAAIQPTRVVNGGVGRDSSGNIRYVIWLEVDGVRIVDFTGNPPTSSVVTLEARSGGITFPNTPTEDAARGMIHGSGLPVGFPDNDPVMAEAVVTLTDATVFKGAIPVISVV